MHCSVMGYEALEDALKKYSEDGYVDLDEILDEHYGTNKKKKLFAPVFK